MAGSPLAAVQGWAEKAGLWFPVEFVEAPRATLGGTLAAGVSGPRRLAYGPARNWVLGLEVVTGRGEILHTGAATVKNVAGYDLTRLQIGAWGTLGIITAATIRLASRPAARLTVEAIYGSPDAAIEAALALASQAAAPVAIEWLDYGAAQAVAGMREFAVSPGECVLLVMFEGERAAVEERRRLAEETVSSARSVSTLDPGAQATAWAARYALWARVQKSYGQVVRLALAVPPARFAQAYGAAVQAMSLCGPVAAGGHAANGIIDFYVGLAGSLSPEAVVAAVRTLRRTIEEMSGHMEVRSAPREFGQAMPWYGTRDTEDLEASLASVFDPDAIFNPHRRPRKPGGH